MSKPTYEELEKRVKELEKAETEHKKVVDTLKETKLLQSSIIESSADIIVLSLDNKYRYTSFNSAHAIEMKKVWDVDIKLGENILDYISDKGERQKAKGNFDRALKDERFTIIDDYRNQNNRFWYKVAYNPLKDSRNKMMGLSLFLTDVTEQKKSELALQESEERLSRFMDSANDSFHILDKDYKLLNINKPALNVLIKNSESVNKKGDVLGKRLTEIYPFLKEDKWWGNFKKVLETGQYVSQEDTVIMPDGGVVHLNVQTFKVGEGIGIIASDITDRKNAEEKLREKDYIIDSASSIIATCDFDGMLTYVNPLFYKRTGHNSKETIGKHFSKYWSVGDNYEKIMNALSNEGKWDGELKVHKKDGSTIDVQVSVATIIDNNNKAIGLMSSSIDITERKKVEEALIESEEKFRTLFKSTMAGVAVSTIDGKFIDANDSYLKMLGYTFDELENLTYPELTPEKWHKMESEMFSEALETGISKNFEKEYIRKDGTIIPIVVNAWIMKDQAGNPTRLGAIVTDITERKQTEETIQTTLEKAVQQEKEISALLKASEAVLLDKEFKDCAMSIFKECKNLLGATAGYVALLSDDGIENEVLFLDAGGRTCTVDESLPMPIRGLRAESYKSGKAVYDNDFMQSKWIKFMPGGHMTLDNVMFAPLNIEGKTVGIMGMANKEGGFNENDARLAAAFGDLAAIALSNSRNLGKLKHSQDELDRMFQFADYMVCIADLNTGYFTKVSPAFTRHLGWSEKELLSRAFLDFIHPDDIQRTADIVKEQMEKGLDVIQFENRYMTKKGDFRWFEWSAIPIPEEGITYSAAYDITERKKAEDLLRDSEAKKNALISNISDVIAILDEQGVVQYKSPNIEQHFGWLPEDLVGTDGWETVHIDDRERIQKEFMELMQNKDLVKTVEYRYKCKDGNFRPIELTATNLLHDPLINGILANYHDITERKKAEEALRESLETSADFMYSIPFGIFIYKYEKPDRLILISGNPEAERLTGIKIDDWIGKEISEIWSEAKKTGVTDSYLKVIETGKTFETEDLYYKDEKLEGAFRIRAFMLPGERLCVSFENITERKNMEEQLQIRQRMDSLGTLAGGIAHDFNNILVGILGNIDLLTLNNENFTLDQKECLTDAGKSCNRAANLIRQFQTLSTGAVRGKSAVDIHDISNEVFSLLKETTDRLITKQIKFKKDNYYVTADSGELHQVLLNLATNSAQAIEERGAKKGDYIRIKAEDYEVAGGDITGLAEGDYVHISFADSGIGMSEEVLKKAFDPMFSTKDKGVKKGQGLGLAMAYNIITRIYDGHIWIDSKEGKGTTFHIYLPKAQPETETESKKANDIKGGTETILVVDDEENVRKFTEKLLTQVGYTVITASDGKEALKIYKKQKDSIDTIILDLTMPQMSGKQVFQQMLDINPDVKVIISSGHGDEYSKKGILAQAKGNIGKPYKMKDLTKTVREVLDS